MVSLIISSLSFTGCGSDKSPYSNSPAKKTGANSAADQQKKYEEFDAGNFDRPTAIDNAWFPLKPGTRFVWEGTTVDDEGDEEDHKVVFTVTDLTKVIGGVRTVVCLDQDIVDGKELVESEIVFFAQDNDGAIWSFGEYPEEYEDGEFVEAPCWIHGVKDGKAGILIPANPKTKTPSFSQGWAPSLNFSDRGKVDQIDSKMTVPFGKYEDVLVIDEWNLEELDAHALKYYAHGVGHIAVRSRGEGDKETLDLIEKKQLSTEELTAARNAALKLEAYAYVRSKDVYAQTKRSVYSGPGTIELPTFKLPDNLVSNKKPVRKISDEKAKEIALKAVSGNVTGIGVEKKKGIRRIVVEVLTKDGSEIDVIIDMVTGKVVDKED